MASKPNPTPANLAQVAQCIAQLPQGTQYASMQAMLVAAHPALAQRTNKSLCTSARGVLRSTNSGVGRGNRYATITPKAWASAYKQVQAQRAQATATAQQARQQAKASA
jgi:hypothetical protein